MTKRTAINMVANWVWYAVVVVSGFVIPRLIARHHGAESLGIWDFGWSLMTFVGMLKMGATGTVNRYVSRYRAVQDWDSLNATVTCCLALLTVSAIVGQLVGLILAGLAPQLLDLTTTAQREETIWTVVFLSAACAIQMPFAVFNSIITGHNRFDVINAIRVIKDVAVLTGVVLALSVNCGVATCAGILLVGEVAAGIGEVVVARRMCPQLHFSPRLCSRRVLRKVFLFGGKSMTRGLARSALYQGNSLLVGAFLGPAALAIYSRQRNLTMQAMKLIKQCAQVFVPVAGELDAHKDTVGLQKLALESGKITFAVSMPLMLLLIVLGDAITTVWMGPQFVATTALTVLALGHLVSLGQLGPYSVLEGMGKHGKPAVIELLVAGAGTIATAVLLTLRPSMDSAAFSLSAALFVGAGICVPIYACRLIKIPLARYVFSAIVQPALANVFFLAALMAIRATITAPLTAIVSALLIAIPTLGVPYAVLLVPSDVRRNLRARFSRTTVRTSTMLKPARPGV